MATQKTTIVSWFDRLKSSIAGIGVGIVLVIGITIGLFWNEGRAGLCCTNRLMAGVPLSPDRLIPRAL